MPMTPEEKTKKLEEIHEQFPSVPMEKLKEWASEETRSATRKDFEEAAKIHDR